MADVPVWCGGCRNRLSLGSMVENGIALMNRYGAYGSVQVKRDEIRGLHGCKLTPLYSLIPPLYGPDVGASAQPQAEGSH